MCKELNCTWKCPNPKHKKSVRRYHNPDNIPICPICRQQMVRVYIMTNYQIKTLQLSKNRVKRNLLTID